MAVLAIVTVKTKYLHWTLTLNIQKKKKATDTKYSEISMFIKNTHFFS